MYSSRGGCSLYRRRSRIPWLTRVFSRAAKVSRGAPVFCTISSNRRQPRKTSRIARRAHFSPTTSRVRATEQVRGAAVRVAMSHIIRQSVDFSDLLVVASVQIPDLLLVEATMALADTAISHRRPSPAAIAVAVLSLGVFMSSLDLFIVNLAFPYIGRDYGGTSLDALSWVLNGYTIVFAAVLVPPGRWADP